MKKGLVTILTIILGMTTGAVVTGKTARRTLSAAKQMSDKHLALYLMMNRWVEIKQDGKNITDYFHRNGYESIAIYGMNYAGERLLHELKDSDIEVKYGIDQRADEIYTDIDVITIDVELPSVDVIVVTPIYFYGEIQDKLAHLTDCAIVSLEDILYEV